MIVTSSPSTKAVGFWSAVLATVCAVTYDVGQIAEWLGWMGARVDAPNGENAMLVPTYDPVAVGTP